jgi:Zn-dependent protease
MLPGYGDSQAELRQKNELLEFAKAWIGTALAFAVLFSGARRTDLQYYLSPAFFNLFLLAALTAGIGVILHELAHRVVARHFGARAHFVANDGMLLISILIAFTGFLFAAPGAVWHEGYLTKRQVGLIAAAGPITNMVLALLFVGVLLTVGNTLPDMLYRGLIIGYFVNALLGVFNMLPFGPLDGTKVLAWSAPIFGILIAIAAGIAFGLPRVVQGLPRIF